MEIREFKKIINEIINCKKILNNARNRLALFTRRSSLSFQSMLLFLLDMRRASLQTRQRSFFQKLSRGMYMSVTKQAISKRRNDFDHSPFVEMLKSLVAAEYSAKNRKKEYKGYILMAIDGSYLQLPRSDALLKEFGYHGSSDLPTAAISVLYDVLNGWPIDVALTHSNMNERSEATKHIINLCAMFPHIARKAIITFDRGYPSLEMFTFLQEKGVKFVIRCSSKSLKEINNAPMGDSVVSLKNGLKVRVVKFTLPTGKTEILVTNHFELELNDIIVIYTMRWGVENLFRLLKDSLFIEGFSGKTVNSIKQDFYATMVMLIGVAIVRDEGNKIAKTVRKNKKNIHEYAVNVSNIVTIMREEFIFMLFYESHNDDYLDKINKIMYTVASVVEPVRKGRHYPRKMGRHPAANLYNKAKYG